MNQRPADHDAVPGDGARVSDAARLTRTIFIGVALGSTSLYAAFTASILVATHLGVSRAWAGVPGSTGVLGTAVGAVVLARIMAARGRRTGLTLGWLIGCAGSILAIVAVVAETFGGLVAAMGMLGVGHASNQLSRFAAADMHPEARRPTVLGWAVWAGTIGAMLGPSLLGPSEMVLRSIGMTVLAGGFVVAAAFYGAAVVCGGLLRPDPSEIAEEDTALATSSPVALQSHGNTARARLAIVIMVTGQLTMTAIMTMTPIHIRDHGHGVGLIGLVMSAHFVGMFAFAPVIGTVVARIGSIKVAVAGLAVLIVAALAAAAAPEDAPVLVGAALFLLGVGWCMGFVAGSALLTRGLRYAARVRLQGSIDAIVWAAAAAAGMLSGVLLANFGYVTLAVLGAVAVFGPLLLVAVKMRQAEFA